MSYSPNMPLATDDPSVSQGQLLTNFAQLNTIFNTDHVTYDALADNGEHLQVTINTVLGAAPGLGTPKASLFTMADANGSSQLFFENFDVPGAANVNRQMTNLPLVAYANAGTAGGAGSYIDTPWGLRIFWLLTNAFAGNATIIVPAGSGTFLNYQITPNTATASTCGCVVQNATTLTAGNTNNQSLRVLILMQLP